MVTADALPWEIDEWRRPFCQRRNSYAARRTPRERRRPASEDARFADLVNAGFTEIENAAQPTIDTFQGQPRGRFIENE
jgi:hypothetical protein